MNARARIASTLMFAALLVAGCVPLNKDGLPTASPEPNAKIDIGGRGLYYMCTGTGLPTVIVETGLGIGGIGDSSWSKVTPEIAKTNRICFYDRAGLELSESGPMPRTSKEVAEDLHLLLTNAHIGPPYVLVGHSIGGLHAAVYTSRFPEEVAGLVLVDSTLPDLGYFETAFATAFPDETLPTLSAPDPRFMEEGLDIPASLEQLQRVASLGDIPLIVISHHLVEMPSVTGISPNMVQLYDLAYLGACNEFASLSSKGSVVFSDTIGHFVQSEDPEVVIEAIRQVLESVDGEN
jgi:pimeloyl-ACP methyl ester carboxylesterase